MEALQATHRKEQRDLQSRITQKKKGATKKTRKGVNDECEALQRKLDEKQQTEIAALKPSEEEVAKGLHNLNIGDYTVPTEVSSTNVSDSPIELEVSAPSAEKIPNGVAPTKKPNRQKARLARRAAEQEAQAIEAEREAANLPNLREHELKSMKEQMEHRNLKEIEIEPDGHCLYSAIGRSLPTDSLPGWAPKVVPYQFVRNRAASFISENPTDFAPFLEEPLDQYVHKIKHTAEWGGQLELQAVARSFKVEIRVLQADGRVEKIEPEAPTHHPPIWLAYYRHSFGLGEHYNALQTAY